MGTYLLAIDQGTTSSRAMVFDQGSQVLGSHQLEFKQHFPQSGWVEHNPKEILDTVIASCRGAIAAAGLEAKEIAAIGITNQRETTLVWDRQTGEPVYNAIVWQDRRTAEFCQRLKDDGRELQVNAKTGLLLDPYFSATKLHWILDHVAGVRERAERGELAFGTVDSFLLWHLTDGKSHRTDATNASRTMLYNIHQHCWDPELLKLFDIPDALLPDVMDSGADFGTCGDHWLGAEVPILGVAGDQQAALIGQGCLEPGMLKSTYGTGAFLMLNTGEQALQSSCRLLTTIGYQLEGKVTYALEGSIFMAGATMQWLRDGLKLMEDCSDSEALVQSLPQDHGVYLVPAFTGMGAPYWQPDARGAIVGLTRDSGIAEITSAALQSVAYQTQDLLQAMRQDGCTIAELRVDGGMVTNNWLMQFLADICELPVDRPEVSETTALGAAYLAGLQLGCFQSLEQIQQQWRRQHRFDAQMQAELRDRLWQGWRQATGQVLGTSDP
ncbi:MAG: glycerol kinase GlpK [Motiliproteus sp.]|nr:glycerol kinase GlpK [Motiliproteus sp.]MCW9051650.1 glycerol kinase GlpK [Motiliproteus sp.]